MNTTSPSPWSISLLPNRLSKKRQIETIIIDSDDDDDNTNGHVINNESYSASSNLSTAISNAITATADIGDDSDFVLLESGRFSANILISLDSVGYSADSRFELVLESVRFGDDSAPNICVKSNTTIVGYLRRGIAQILSPLILAKRIELEAVVDKFTLITAHPSRSVCISVIVLTSPNNDRAIQEFLHHVHLVKPPPPKSPPPVPSSHPIKAADSEFKPTRISNQNIPSSHQRSIQHIQMLTDIKNHMNFDMKHEYRPFQRPLVSTFKHDASPNLLGPTLLPTFPYASSIFPPHPPYSASSIPPRLSTSTASFMPASNVTNVLLDAGMDLRFSALLSSSTDLDESSRAQILDAIGMKEEELANLPEAPQPNGLVTQLLPYQRQGLGWMLRSEHPIEPTSTSESQFWTLRTIAVQPSSSTYTAGGGASDMQVYFNSATNSVAQCQPRLARGCLIADDMGLGKTIQILALILSDPSGRPFIEKGGGSSVSYCDATLIVCPLSVVGNWEAQIKQHVQPSHLRLYVYHGPARNMSIRFLQSRDLVITTYETVANSSGDRSPLHQIKWRRVVLDEGHNIRTPKTKRSQAACSLFAERKIVLTGTPINNKLADLYPLLKFMEFYPFDNNAVWKKTIENPCKQGRPEGMYKLQVLMRNMCLRRTKRMKLNGKPLLELPAFNSFVHKVTFSEPERALYARWEAKSRLTFEEILKNSKARAHAKQMGCSDRSLPSARSFGCMLKYLLRLRQLCNHGKLIEKGYVAAGSTELDRLLGSLRENMAEDCLMCLEPMKVPAITMCNHWFCYECIKDLIEVEGACPVCRTDMPMEQVYTLPNDEEDDDGQNGGCKKLNLRKVKHEKTRSGPASNSNFDEDTEDEIKIVESPKFYSVFSKPADRKIDFFKNEKSASTSTNSVCESGVAVKKQQRLCKTEQATDIESSTKINALMTFLITCRTSTPETKSVVFSQWTSMLDLIETPLSKAGFEFVRLDGTMNRQLREANIDLFTHNPRVQVFLISTMCGSVGLNLVAASNCFMVDPCWNPMVERQAIDRIYRIGQKKPVTVVKFAMENSIEERVLKKQEEKRAMAEDALGETNPYSERTTRSSRIDDIRALLGTATKDDYRLAEGLADFD